MKDKTRKRIITVLIILTVAFAWIHSAMPVPVSQGESGHVLAFLRPILKLFLPEHMVTDHLVRKLAHFAEYAALGAELALYVLPDAGIRPKSIVRVLYAGATVALIDETIQIFSGRGPMISDVWLDVGGSATGALVICIILKIVSGKKDKRKTLTESGDKDYGKA